MLEGWNGGDLGREGWGGEGALCLRLLPEGGGEGWEEERGGVTCFEYERGLWSITKTDDYPKGIFRHFVAKGARDAKDVMISTHERSPLFLCKGRVWMHGQSLAGCRDNPLKDL